MSWIKRNLSLVVGVAVAVGLLGVAGYFLWLQIGRESQVSTDLTTQIDEYQTLTTLDPSATEPNIEAVKEEQERLAVLLEETRKQYVPVGTFTNMDSATFKSMLDTTVYELEQLSRRQGVKTPPQFTYAFKSQKDSLNFEQQDLLPWTYQLLEIKALCEAVYAARVHSLGGVRRAAVSKKDIASADILTVTKASTNTVVDAVVTPYEVTFQGFTAELGEVIDNLLRSPYCFVIKNINVDKATGEGTEGTDGVEGGAPAMFDYSSRYGVTPGAQPGGSTAADLLRNRYGLRGPAGPGGRYGGRYRGETGSTQPMNVPDQSAYVQMTPAIPVRRGPETVINEELLKITMLVDAVRLRGGPAK